MTQEKARVALNVVANTLQSKPQRVYLLFDCWATHYFNANKLVGKLGNNPCMIEKRVYYKYFLR